MCEDCFSMREYATFRFLSNAATLSPRGTEQPYIIYVYVYKANTEMYISTCCV